MTPKILKNLFIEKAGILEQLSEIQKIQLLSIYSTPDYLRQVPELVDLLNWANKLEKRVGEPRYDVCCQGNLDSSINLKIYNVSLNGIGCEIDSHLNRFATYNLKIAIAPLEVIELQAKPIWIGGHGKVGFKILQAPNKWQEYINSFENFEAPLVAA